MFHQFVLINVLRIELFIALNQCSGNILPLEVPLAVLNQLSIKLGPSGQPYFHQSNTQHVSILNSEINDPPNFVKNIFISVNKFFKNFWKKHLISWLKFHILLFCWNLTITFAAFVPGKNCYIGGNDQVLEMLNSWSNIRLRFGPSQSKLFFVWLRGIWYFKSKEVNGNGGKEKYRN